MELNGVLNLQTQFQMEILIKLFKKVKKKAIKIDVFCLLQDLS